jgi:hypothetical protein
MSVDLPQSVTNIGDGAFSCCSALSFVNIPGELEYIGGYAFQECQSLCKVNLPRRLLRLGPGAFIECSAITSIKVSPGLKMIETATFSGCESLINVCIPSSVEKIFFRAFADCTSLVNVYLLNISMEISSDSFEGCTSLQNLYHQSFHAQTEAGILSLESNSASPINGDVDEIQFHHWLKSRCDSYPFWYKCWTDRLTMEDIQAIILEEGLDGIFHMEECTGMNAFDVLLSNPNLGDRYFELIAIIIMNLLSSCKPTSCNPQKRKRVH